MHNLFPHFPLHLNLFSLFGLILLLGLVGGEIAKRIPFLPRISGYIFIGFLFGPGGFNMVSSSVLANVHIFVDISLSLILFDLGRHLDFDWLRNDRGLLPMAIAESGLTFAFIFSVLYLWVGLPQFQSALAATIAIATSPALVMMVAHDLSSEGPVTRRTLILTSLNNLFGLVIFTILLPMTEKVTSIGFTLGSYILYRLFGSIILALLIFICMRGLASFIGKQKDNQFVMLVGALILTIGLARVLSLSSMLALFMLGVAARNLDRKNTLMEIDFGWLARLFFILLFVVTGVYLQLQGLWYATGAVLIFILARMFAKIGGICLFAKASRLTVKQTFALSLTLFPMAEIAIGMSNRINDFNPDFSRQLFIIITAVVAVFNIIGPIITQFVFIKTGEANSDSNKQEVLS